MGHLFRLIGIGIIGAIIFVTMAGGDATMVGEGVGNAAQAVGEFFTGLMHGLNVDTGATNELGG